MANRGIIGIFKLLISIIVCQCAGIIGSIFTANALPVWYEALNKPIFTPPNWLFAPAWIALYLLMAIAAFLIWWRGLHIKPVRIALILFLIQLVLNTLWSVVFFGFKSILLGLVVIVILWIMILVTMIQFYKISIAAGSLLVPYILWVSFAACLNGAIYLLN